MQITSVSEFKINNRKPFQLPSGRVIEICKIDESTKQYLGTYARLIQGIKPDEIIQELKNNTELLMQGLHVANLILTKGISRPKISAEPIHLLGDDEIHVTDLGSDKEAALKAILEFNGISIPA